jgi:hypothetical protein
MAVLVVMGAVGVVLLGDAALKSGFGTALLLAPWVLLVIWVVYVAMHLSHIAIDPAGATVQNYLRRSFLPWQRVEAIQMQWQIVFTLDDRQTVKAFGGPVAGRPGRAERREEARPASPPPALRDLYLIQEQWQAARAEGAPAGDVRRSWDYPSLAALAVILLWAAVAVVIAG